MKPSTVEYRIEIERESIPIRGNCIASGDSAYDRQVEDEIIARRKAGSIWAWASVTVIASYQGYEGYNHLGCCSYANQNDFKKCDYYQQMQGEALADLLQKLKPASEAYLELTDNLKVRSLPV
jgi:hypothetical protein